MKVVLLLLVAALFVQGSMAQVGAQQLPADSKHPNQCYNPETKEAHPVGSKWYKPGECLEYSCSKSGNNFLVQFAGCGKIAPPKPPCRFVSDETKRHPGCCPKIEC